MKRRNMSGFRFQLLPRADDPRRVWLHRCAHTPLNWWRITRHQVSYPARDNWVSQLDLPGRWNP